MSHARIIVTGIRGGGGKTLLSLGLSRFFANAGLQVKPYKKGPDYIDTAWLSLAARCIACNLDPFFLSAERLNALFVHAQNTAQADLALIEGNRGLYDGRDLAGSCSTAELARILQCPLLLVLDCSKMTRTAAAVVTGLAHFEPGITLAGVILNKVHRERHVTLLRQSIEHYTGIPVLGTLPEIVDNPLPERHMGLSMQLSVTAEKMLEALAGQIGAGLDTAAILKIAGSAPALQAPAFWPPAVRPVRPVRIGVVRDAALWFYYEENMEALRRAGAELVEISLLDSAPWPVLDGLYLGGGFPELMPEALVQAQKLPCIHDLAAKGLPIYAECGGFMLLCDTLIMGGKSYPMGKVFPLDTEFSSKPQGLGYVEAEVLHDNPFHPCGVKMRGHEFHYSRCKNPRKKILEHILRLDSGTGMGKGLDGLVFKNTFASYTHLYAPAVPHWAPRFVQLCQNYAGAQA